MRKQIYPVVQFSNPYISAILWWKPDSLFRKQSLDKTDEEETEFLLENQLTLEDQLISDNQLSSENRLSLTPSDQLLVSDLVPPEERNNAKLLLLFLITSIYVVSSLCFLWH